ncbi:MAG: glycosyltransferase family 2 protein [Candidatus Azobacteroides sp.]|nr:glycosyltransferase family 2 protein [Candidatus Azobacteroides sp.]
MSNQPALSFCITCKNRLYQIRHTLRKNLNDNMLHDNFIEFILVDFGSNDGLRDWVISNFQPELASGYLKYYYTEELPLWHASIAKNTAHFCAAGKILVNLDCDNFTGTWGGTYVMSTFAQLGDRIVMHQFSGRIGSGTFGRIAVKRKYFYMLGGYDETLDPMGFEDDDLILRHIQIGHKYISLTDNRFNQSIPNTIEESILHTGSSKNYEMMLQYNRNVAHYNLSEGRLIANAGKFGIRKNIFDHNGKKFQPKIINHE